MFIHQYELFKMLPNESISSMLTRMTTITNSLDVLGKTYTNTNIAKDLGSKGDDCRTWTCGVRESFGVAT
jgi:hypothetical protein